MSELKRIPVIPEHEKAMEGFMDQQLRVFWMADEIKVEKDVQDVLVNFSEAERHGVISTLKLFTIYEDYAGEEYWGGRFKKMYESSTAACRMAAAFAMFESCVHAPFYSKINQLLHIDTPEFYLSYLDDDALKSRIDHIGSIVDHEDDAISLGMFSFVEGAVLYSSFAFLKHFQAQGKNKLSNIVRGIDFSCRDEQLHCVGGSWCFRMKTQHYTKERMAQIEAKIREGAQKIMEHEEKIISMVFDKGEIEGITATQMSNFVKSRINECLKLLGFKPEYEVKYNPIAEWFYKSINDYQFNDIFAGQGREYHRAWDDAGFVWKGPAE